MFEIHVKNDAFIAREWEPIKQDLSLSFESSSFNHGYTIASVFSEVQDEIFAIKQQTTKHIVALNENSVVVGAIFSVFADQKENVDKEICDAGWFFTSARLDEKERTQIALEMVRSFHQLAREVGYKKVIVEIGTKEGEKFLSRRIGYVPLSQSADNKLWCYEL